MIYPKLQQVMGVTLVVLSLVGCGTPATTAVPQAPAATSTQEPPTPVPAPTQVATSVSSAAGREVGDMSAPNSYSPGVIGDYIIFEITINEPDRQVSFSIKQTLVEVENNRFRIIQEIVKGNPPEDYPSVAPEIWINFSDISTALDRRNIGEMWTETNREGQEISIRRLQNEAVKIGESSFEAIVVEIKPVDELMRWKLTQYFSYEAPIAPTINTEQISWEIGPGGGKIYSNYSQKITEIGRVSK